MSGIGSVKDGLKIYYQASVFFFNNMPGEEVFLPDVVFLIYDFINLAFVGMWFNLIINEFIKCVFSQWIWL